MIFSIALCLVVSQAGASNSRLSTLLAGAQKPPDDIRAILELDVFEYFKLDRRFDSELKKKAFQKTDEYRDDLAKLEELKGSVRKQDFVIVAAKELGDYNVKKGAFEIVLGWNMGQGTYGARPPKSFEEICFPALPTKSVPFEMAGEAIRGVVTESLFVPIDEASALDIENSKGRVHVYLFFNVDDVRKVRFDYLSLVSDGSQDWFAITRRCPTANKVRVVVANEQSDQILFDKTYKTAK